MAEHRGNWFVWLSLTVLLVGSVAVAFDNLREMYMRYKLMTFGGETEAVINSVATVGTAKHRHLVVDLMYAATLGETRHPAPIRISNDFFQSISTDGALIVKRTTVSYIDEDAAVLPVIQADQSRGWELLTATVTILSSLIGPLAILFILARKGRTA